MIISFFIEIFYKGRQGESRAISRDDNRTTPFLLQGCKKHKITNKMFLLKNIRTRVYLTNYKYKIVVSSNQQIDIHVTFYRI